MLDLGGTFREKSASETLAAIAPYIKKFGITRTARITGLDTLGIPVYTSIRPNSKSLSTSQGKGLTDELAKCSSLMESIEIAFAEEASADFRSKTSTLEAEFIDPSALPSSGYVPLDSSAYEWEWCNGINLLNNRQCFVPFEAISFNLDPNTHAHYLLKKSTTGLASGNIYDEAVCHSLYEIIERKCTKQYKTLQDKSARFIDNNTIDCDAAIRLIKVFESNNINVLISDISNEFNIPSFSCTITDSNPFRNLGAFAGYGSHHNKSIALNRALTEAAQSRLTHIAGSRDDMFPVNYNKMHLESNFTGIIDYKALPSLSFDSFSKAKEDLLNKFSQLGQIQLVAVEHTTKEDSISVVHCLAPGL